MKALKKAGAACGAGAVSGAGAGAVSGARPVSRVGATCGVVVPLGGSSVVDELTAVRSSCLRFILVLFSPSCLVTKLHLANQSFQSCLDSSLFAYLKLDSRP